MDKWDFLRAEHSRYLREMKKVPSGYISTWKNWPFADAMSFLSNRTKPQKTITLRKLSDFDTMKLSDLPGYLEEGDCKDGIKFLSKEIESQSGLDNIEGQYVTSTAHSSKERKNNKTNESLTAENGTVTDNMIEYLKIITAQVQSQRNSRELEGPTLTFFRSLVPDVEKLNSGKQRQFKARVIQMLNSMLDSQEGL